MGATQLLYNGSDTFANISQYLAWEGLENGSLVD